MFRRLRQHVSKRTALILCGILLLALGIDFVFFTGFFASDDIGYLEGIRGLAGDGDWLPSLATTRIGITLPGALVHKLTGGSIGAVVWFHVCYHLGLVLVAYVLGRLLLDERAGLIGAALIAINPLLYVHAGAVLPDNAAAFWLGGSMIALVATRRYADPGTHVLSWNRRRFLGYFAAGVMLGLCYWCKETALIMTIPAAVFLMTAGPSFRSLLWIQNGAILAFGLVTAIIFEVLILRVATGDWVNRLTVMKEAGDVFFYTDMERQGYTPFARFSYASDQLTKWMPLTTWLLMLGSALFGLTRVRNAGIMMFFWWPLVYLTIGTTSFTEYLPPTIQGRYYAIVILPAAVMTAISISVLIERWQQRNPNAWTRAALVVTLSLVGVYECNHNLPRAGTLYRSTEVRAFILALEQVRDRYHYPVVISPYYSSRMWPLLHGRKHITIDVHGQKRPPPPYVYVRMMSAGDVPEPDPIAPPPLRVDRQFQVEAPASQWEVIKDSIRHMTSVKVRTKMKLANKKRWAEVFLVRPPAVPKPEPAPGKRDPDRPDDPPGENPAPTP